MSVTPAVRQAIHRLLLSASPEEQASLREQIRDENYYKHIWNIYINNPFMALTAEEVEYFRRFSQYELLTNIILARDAASKSKATKISVFCMPKSGSSFVQSVIQKTLNIPLVSMTGFAKSGQNSHFGMNAREQELDELAVVKSILLNPNGFVAQNHTKCTLFLARQLKFYGIYPIVTVRNILDCIVSFDDMMISWRRDFGTPGWLIDTPFHIPENYPNIEEQERYKILSRSFGIWLIGFYLSWIRFTRLGAVNPLFIEYEADITNPGSLVDKLSSQIPMTNVQKDHLALHAAQPDARKARLNVGIRGRGEKIGSDIVEFLLDHARHFSSELSSAEIRYLIR